MMLIDVNVLVYAHRRDAIDHKLYLKWLEGIIDGDSGYGISDIVMSGFLRIVTHPAIFNPPSPMKEAMAFVSELRGQAHCTVLAPGLRHWGIFSRLCQTVGVKGSLVPDAYLAALAIETGSEWITTDRDFSRFPGLRCRHPLQAKGTTHL